MLRIIDDGHHQEFKVGGSVIYYTRVGWGELRDIRGECRDPKTLQVDLGQTDELLLRRHVHSWQNVLDAKGDQVSFSIEALLKLPPLIVDALIGSIYAAAAEEEDKQGESGGSSTT